MQQRHWPHWHYFPTMSERDTFSVTCEVRSLWCGFHFHLPQAKHVRFFLIAWVVFEVFERAVWVEVVLFVFQEIIQKAVKVVKCRRHLRLSYCWTWTWDDKESDFRRVALAQRTPVGCFTHESSAGGCQVGIREPSFWDLFANCLFRDQAFLCARRLLSPWPVWERSVSRLVSYSSPFMWNLGLCWLTSCSVLCDHLF